MITNIEELNVINLHEIPSGKKSFIAKVHTISDEEELNYHGYFESVSYIYLNEIKIIIDGTCYKVDCSGNYIRSKVGKKLEKLNLESGDIISFDAIVEDEEIEFSYVEGEDSLDADKLYYEPFAVLPKSYKGLITAEIYETEFTLNDRIFKNNYIKCFNRSAMKNAIKKLNYLRNATDKQKGYFREIQRMYFDGKHIKNLSNIEKF